MRVTLSEGNTANVGRSSVGCAESVLLLAVLSTIER